MKSHNRSNAAVLLRGKFGGKALLRIIPWFLLASSYFSVIMVSSAAEFEPYELNGGLVTAVAGKDFCILATDTRMFNSGGYNLASRYHLKCRMWSVDDTMLGETVEQLLRTTHTTNNHERAKTRLEAFLKKQVAVGRVTNGVAVQDIVTRYGKV